MKLSAEHRLATYGTLAPGQINNDQLADLHGEWTQGKVRGRLINEGWGAAHSCPGIILDPDGQEVDVDVFVSADLPAHWSRLDVFEGDGYRRSTVRILTKDGEIEGSIYELVS
jgi:gamma-glutamylcyclotransferase (GGCT)/AIG2-like uncharacterized protein YtfP